MLLMRRGRLVFAPSLVAYMPLMPFLIAIGIVVIAIQKIAEDAPIAGGTSSVLLILTAISLANLSFKKRALQEATRRAIISEFKWNDNIDPLEFERRCAEAMHLSGWTARTTKGSGDQGVDVLADKRGTKLVLQCKLYTNTVGNKAVQEVFAAKTFSDAKFAAVVSNNSYSRGAKELAIKTGVLLLHYSDLRRANLLFGFPADGVPPLEYQSGVTPSDVKRARRYVMFCAIASLPLVLIGFGFDVAHKNQSNGQTSTIAAILSPETVAASAHDLTVDTVKSSTRELSPVPPSTSVGKQTADYAPPFTNARGSLSAALNQNSAT